VQLDDLDKTADLSVQRRRKRQAEAEARAEAAAAGLPENATHHDIAKAITAALTLDGHAPAYAGGSFLLPQSSGLWVPASHERLQVIAAERFGGQKLMRKHSDFRQVVDHLAALVEAPGFFDEVPAGIVSPGGLHRLDGAGHVECVPLGLASRQTFAIEWEPDVQAECPLVDGVLSAAFAGADEAVQTAAFWECLGATLFGLMPRLQLVVLMLGRERSGKSLLQRLIERLFPRDAVCAVPPGRWSSEYHVATLALKRLNVVGELHDESAVPAADFKNVTGLNLVTGRHPTHRPFSFRCLAAHWFASNVLPIAMDRTEGFYRRWVVLHFANTVPADQADPDLFDKIVATEMPGLLGQAVLGAERVARTGRIQRSAQHDRLMQRWRLAANPLQQFLLDDEWIELDPDAREHGAPEVYQAYRRWSAVCGFRNPFGRNHFLELLDATGASRGVSIKRIGSRNVVAGLRLLKGPEL
jgi:P4 family phage/plasmid primase-like protien